VWGPTESGDESPSKESRLAPGLGTAIPRWPKAKLWSAGGLPPLWACRAAGERGSATGALAPIPEKHTPPLETRGAYCDCT